MICCECGCTCGNHSAIIVVGGYHDAGIVEALAELTAMFEPDDELYHMSMSLRSYSASDFLLPVMPTHSEPFAGVKREASPWNKRHLHRELKQNKKYQNKQMRNRRMR